MLKQTTPCNSDEYKYKMPNVYLEDGENAEVILEPGDILISNLAGFDEILDVLVRHVEVFMPDEDWTPAKVIDEFVGCL